MNYHWGLLAPPNWAFVSGYGARTTRQAIKTAFAPLGLLHLSREDA